MAKHSPLPPIDELRKRLAYRSDGVLIWKRPNSNYVKAGSEAGCLKASGYKSFSFNNVTYRAHRVVWAIVKGEDPNEWQIDHINGSKADNRIENLRKANSYQNQQNRPRAKGYRFDNNAKKWITGISCNRKFIYLGLFDAKEQAREAYLRAKEKLHGEFMPSDMKHELGQIDGPTSQLDLFND